LDERKDGIQSNCRPLKITHNNGSEIVSQIETGGLFFSALEVVWSLREVFEEKVKEKHKRSKWLKFDGEGNL
jgi:hypothetical protein